jgi:hypothetical protein
MDQVETGSGRQIERFFGHHQPEAMALEPLAQVSWLDDGNFTDVFLFQWVKHGRKPPLSE